jgi:hypothetical protein
MIASAPVITSTACRQSRGRQRQPLVMRPPHPRGVVLRAEADDDEGARSRRRLNEVRDERLARAVDPMEILDQAHAWLAPAPRVDQPLHGLEEAALAHLGVETRQRALGIRDTQEVEEEREGVGQGGVEQQELAGDLLAHCLRGVLRADPEVPAQELQHQEVRDHLPVRRTVHLVDRDPARAAALDELVGKAALANARLGHDADDLPVARSRPCQGGLQGRDLRIPPDEAREAARP